MSNLDTLIFNFIHYPAEKWWLLDWFGVFSAKYLPYFLVIAAVYFLFKKKNRQRIYAFALMFLSVILARGIIVEVIRFFYCRSKPFSILNFNPLVSVDGMASFPSGHAAAFFALATAIFFLSRRFGKWFFILSFLIIIARVFTGLHWPSDILVGAVIGILSALFVKKILPKTEN